MCCCPAVISELIARTYGRGTESYLKRKPSNDREYLHVDPTLVALRRNPCDPSTLPSILVLQIALPVS